MSFIVCQSLWIIMKDACLIDRRETFNSILLNCMYTHTEDALYAVLYCTSPTTVYRKDTPPPPPPPIHGQFVESHLRAGTHTNIPVRRFLAEIHIPALLYLLYTYVKEASFLKKNSTFKGT